MARFNRCSQCIQRAKLCTLCKTYLCYHHYVNHSCMIDKAPAKTAREERGDLDDPSEEVMAYQERRDNELRREEDL